MRKITFEDVMKFYPRHNESVFKKIVEAQRNSSLIPFVGAGLSVFCGYKLWGDVLRELAEFIPVDDERKTALTQIDGGAYEEAAQTILEAYPPMLDQLPDLISPSKIEGCPQEKFKTSAAFALPYLFAQGLVMTTNFDRVLETVYLRYGGKPIETVIPNQQDRLAQLRQNQALGLFKLHGDIGDDMVSIDDLVFTGKQYAEKYADGSPLVQELTRWFENRRLLFLGCSLNVDRTMDVLRSVTKAQTGIRHYAILSCKKADISKRLKELSDLGIRPIFYDEGDHDAVRVILERLLEETDQRAYKDFCTASRVVPATTKEERRLLFDADYFPFTGRKKELEALEAFCASPDSISWWAVTGPGGMGKSRLVYEFANQRREEGWQIARFEARPSKDSHATSLESLDKWVPGTTRTVVVLDDVQAHMEQVRRWLNETVRRPRSQKLRILLLEREGEELNASSWLGAEARDGIPEEWCYEERFLCLEPMTNEDLTSIMDDYAAAAGKKLDAARLLKTLERVDAGLKRPLYAIAIADAACQGKNPTNWDRKRVLDALLDRELDFHFNRFKGMTGTRVTQTLQEELKELMARSCIQGVLPLDKVQWKAYPKLVRKMEDAGMDAQEFLEGLGLLRTVLFHSIKVDESGNPVGEPSEEKQKVIALSCPDLIKEHLVLNLALEGGKKKLLFPPNWEQNPGQLIFLGRLLADYSDRLRGQNEYWDTLFKVEPRKLLSARLYGHILWGYALKYPDNASVAIDRLARLYDEMGHASEIAVEYAMGLFNLTVHQELEGRMETVDRLDKLYQNHSDIPEIAVQFAKGLFNLTIHQDLERRTETVARLDKLYQNHSDIPEIAVHFAKALVNSTIGQDSKGCLETIERLKKISQSHLNREEMEESLAICLVNLSLYQKSEAEVRATLARSKEILERYLNNRTIQLGHAETWFNLTLQQREADIPATVEDIAAYLRANAGVIPQFKEDLGKYLSKHPDHAARYEALLRL